MLSAQGNSEENSAGIHELAAYSLRNRLAALSPAQRERIRHTLPHSFRAGSGQFGIWLNEQLNPGTHLYINPAVLRIQGLLDESVLRKALVEIQKRHAPLRSRYLDDEDGDLGVVVDPAGLAPLDWRTYDVRGAELPWEKAAALIEEQTFESFDLAAGPVWRTVVIRYADDQYLLGLVFHHIVSDGGTLGIVFRELTTIYEGLAESRAYTLPTIPTSYFSLVAERERDVRQESLRYWIDRLAAAPNEIRLRGQGDAGDHEAGAIPVALSAELTARLSRTCVRRGASSFAGLLAAFATLLAVESGQRDLVLTTPVDTRGAHGANLVGCFVNTVVLRLAPRDEDTLEGVLAEAATTLTEALDHSDVPFAQVLAAVDSKRRGAPLPFGSVGIVHNNAPLGPLAWKGLDVARHPLPVRHIKHELTLSVGRTPEGTVGHLEYDDCHSETTIRALVRRWTWVVEEIADRPETRVGDLRRLMDVHP
jgi:hypothetical protein